MKFLTHVPNTKKENTKFLYFQAPWGSLKDGENSDDFDNRLQATEEPYGLAHRFLNIFRKKDKGETKTTSRERLNSNVINTRSRVHRATEPEVALDKDGFPLALANGTEVGLGRSPNPQSPESASDNYERISDITAGAVLNSLDGKRDWFGTILRQQKSTTDPRISKIFHPGFWFTVFGGERSGMKSLLKPMGEHLKNTLSSTQHPYSNVTRVLADNSLEETIKNLTTQSTIARGTNQPSIAMLDATESIFDRVFSEQLGRVNDMSDVGEEHYGSIDLTLNFGRTFGHKILSKGTTYGMEKGLRKIKADFVTSRTALTKRNENIQASLRNKIGSHKESGMTNEQTEIWKEIRFAVEQPEDFINGGSTANTGANLYELTGNSNPTVLLDVINSYFASEVISLDLIDRSTASTEESWSRMEIRHNQIESEDTTHWPDVAGIQQELRSPDVRIEPYRGDVSIRVAITILQRGIVDAFGIDIASIYRNDAQTESVFPQLSLEERLIYILKFLNGQSDETLPGNPSRAEIIRKLPPKTQGVLMQYLNTLENKLESLHTSGNLHEPESMEAREIFASRARGVIDAAAEAMESAPELIEKARLEDPTAFTEILGKLENFVGLHDDFKAFFDEHPESLFDVDKDVYTGIFQRLKGLRDYLGTADEGYIKTIADRRGKYEKLIKDLPTDVVPHPYTEGLMLRPKIETIDGEEHITSGEEQELTLRIKKAEEELDAVPAIITTSIPQGDAVELDTTKSQSLENRRDKLQTSLEAMRDAKQGVSSFSFPPITRHEFYKGAVTNVSNRMNTVLGRLGVSSRSDGESLAGNAFNDRFNRYFKREIHESMQNQITEQITNSLTGNFERLENIEDPEGLVMQDLHFVDTTHTGGDIAIPTAFKSDHVWKNSRIVYKQGSTTMAEVQNNGEEYVVLISGNAEPREITDKDGRVIGKSYTNMKAYKKTEAMIGMFQSNNPLAYLPGNSDLKGAIVSFSFGPSSKSSVQDSEPPKGIYQPD